MALTGRVMVFPDEEGNQVEVEITDDVDAMKKVLIEQVGMPEDQAATVAPQLVDAALTAHCSGCEARYQTERLMEDPSIKEPVNSVLEVVIRVMESLPIERHADFSTALMGTLTDAMVGPDEEHVHE